MPRLEIGCTDEVMAHLKRLARLGIHGATPEHCAHHLIKCELERLVISGLLPLQASTPPTTEDS